MTVRSTQKPPTTDGQKEVDKDWTASKFKEEALKPGDPTAHQVSILNGHVYEPDPILRHLPTGSDSSLDRGKGATLWIMVLVVCVLVLNISAKLNDVLSAAENLLSGTAKFLSGTGTGIASFLLSLVNTMWNGMANVVAEFFNGLERVCKARYNKPDKEVK
jgi:hypothetical protein